MFGKVESNFRPTDKVRIISGISHYIGRVGEVECVYPAGLLADHELVKVVFSLFSVGHFKPEELAFTEPR